MTFRAWRIVKSKHAYTAFSGDGPWKFGSRWNSPGVEVVYVSSTLALAMLETLVHLQDQEFLDRFVVFEVSFDEALVTRVESVALPKTWGESPPLKSVQKIGDVWFSGAASAVLCVPSVIVSTEGNYLLNPAHPDFEEMVIAPKQPVHFGPRLIKPRAR